MNEALIADFRARRPAALARVVSLVENRAPGSAELLAVLHASAQRAHRIGVTGPPGAGKSTVTAQLVKRFREQGRTVGVIAVDPTSPNTGGALLGDRVRMEAVALDDGVFIRSMATRGSLGGLASATRDVCDVLDAYGFDRVIVETVGVGQSELEISHTADTNVVLFVPESGDAIQTLKAGLTEVGDIFLVNKCDRPGGDRLASELELMLELRTDENRTWTPQILQVIAKDGIGIAELVTAIESHTSWLASSGELRRRRRERLRVRVRDAVTDLIRERVWNNGNASRTIDAQLDALEAGRVAPLDVAGTILADVSARSHSTH